MQSIPFTTVEKSPLVHRSINSNDNYRHPKLIDTPVRRASYRRSDPRLLILLLEVHSPASRLGQSPRKLRFWKTSCRLAAPSLLPPDRHFSHSPVGISYALPVSRFDPPSTGRLLAQERNFAIVHAVILLLCHGNRESRLARALSRRGTTTLLR